jgi:ABC-type uncharacterized transport system substrate-binding protein
VGVSFAQNGRTAAETALAVLAGSKVAPEIYPDECEITLNLGAAAEVGLLFSPGMRSQAHKIIP